MLCFALAWNTRAFPLEPIKGNWGEFTAFVEKQASQSNSSSSSVGNSQHWSKLILCSEVLTQYSEGRWMQVQCGLVRTRLHQKPGCDLFFNRSPHKNFDIENLVALGAAHEKPTTLQQSNSVPPLGFQRFFQLISAVNIFLFPFLLNLWTILQLKPLNSELLCSNHSTKEIPRIKTWVTRNDNW